MHSEIGSWFDVRLRSYGISIGCTLGSFALLSTAATSANIAANCGLFASAALVARSGRESLKISDRMNNNLRLFNQVAETHQQKGTGSLMEMFYKQQSSPVLNIGTAQLEQPALPAATTYDWNNIESESVGFLICGNSGSAKSSLATWLAGHLTQSTPMAVIALDPHFNDCWQMSGIKSVGKIQDIESCLIWLISELDRRCDRKGLKQPLGDPIFVICDELNAAIERFENPKVIESALKRLGSEGRKFGITFCGLNQSSNASAIGIDAKYRSNYTLILLGQSARTHPKLGKELADVAYPCMLTGSIADAIAIHPTHGSYNQFKKTGNPPMNLKPINQLPLPEGLNRLLGDRISAKPELPESNESVVNRLNRALELDFQDSGSDSEVAITNPKDDDLRDRIAELRASGLNQNQIILAIWQAKTGGNKAYKDALSKYRRLTN